MATLFDGVQEIKEGSTEPTKDISMAWLEKQKTDLQTKISDHEKNLIDFEKSLDWEENVLDGWECRLEETRKRLSRHINGIGLGYALSKSPCVEQVDNARARIGSLKSSIDGCKSMLHTYKTELDNIEDLLRQPVAKRDAAMKAHYDSKEQERIKNEQAEKKLADEKIKAEENGLDKKNSAIIIAIGAVVIVIGLLIFNSATRPIVVVADVNGDSQFNPNINYTSFTDSRDGKSYKTVKIGSQTWMAEDLKVETANSVCYDNNPSNCMAFGRLYTWNDAQNVCPVGWHLPTDAEWTQLVDYAGYSIKTAGKTAGKKLKSKTGWNNNGNGSDGYGFSALPNGIADSSDSYCLGEKGFWWTATEQSVSSAWSWGIIHSRDGIAKQNSVKWSLTAVRCVQDVGSEQALNNIIGIWRGTYDADQGRTGLTLTVAKADNAYKSVFDFYNLPGKSNAANGKYNMNVSYNTSTGRYFLEGYEWIDRPPNYGFVNLDGILIEEDVFSGTLNGSTYNFRVERVDQAKRKVAAPTTTSVVTEFVDSRDGKSYKKVTIGTQIWMAENLNYNLSGSKCYDNSSTKCDEYGRLYNWFQAKKVCPAGWHLPSDAEWTTLTDYVGGEKTAGKQLRSTSGWTWNNGDNISGNGTDKYEFSALPGGRGDPDGDFSSVGEGGIWWSATKGNDGSAWYWGMYYNGWYMYRDNMDKKYLYSVRCIQDVRQ